MVWCVRLLGCCVVIKGSCRSCRRSAGLALPLVGILVRLSTEDMISSPSRAMPGCSSPPRWWPFPVHPLRHVPGGDALPGQRRLIAIAKAVTISALVLPLLVYWYRSSPAVVLRPLVFNYWWFSMLLIGGLRLAMRQYFMGDWYSAVQSVPFSIARMACPGWPSMARGRPANQLVAALRSRSGDASGGVHR